MRGIQIALHATLLVPLVWWAWLGVELGGLAGALWSMLLLAAFYTCVLLHELGHSLVAQRYAVVVSRILLLPIGGIAQLSHIPREPARELAITAAGPAVNFALALILGLTLPFAPGWWAVPVPLTPGDFGRALFLLNLVMGVFNLLPVFPMDGGRVLRALLARRLPYVRATRIATRVGQVLGLVALGLGAWHDRWGLVALFSFVLVVGEIELRSVLALERDEAHWARWYRRRETLLAGGSSHGTGHGTAAGIDPPTGLN